jgi:hypothetical protein
LRICGPCVSNEKGTARQIEQKNVDLQKASDNSIDYTRLANQIEKSRRKRNPPKVRSASLAMDEARAPVLLIRGENLAVNPRFPPVAVVNQVLADVISSSGTELKIRIDRQHRFGDDNEVVLTVDPFAVLKVQVKEQPK